MNGRKVTCICRQCQTPFEIGASAFNRAQRTGANLYCDRMCAGLARRLKNPLTKAERVAAKAEYDRKRREELQEELRVKKAEYHKRTYDPAKAAVIRKMRMPYHVQYCRQPWYVAYKREYDRRLRASKYGDFAEVFLLLQQVKQEIAERAGKEVNLEKAREKANERKCPAGEDPERGQPETGSLGNAE